MSSTFKQATMKCCTTQEGDILCPAEHLSSIFPSSLNYTDEAFENRWRFVS